MSTPLLIVARLRESLKRLAGLGNVSYLAADIHVLREVLGFTITDLQILYPDDLSTSQRHQLLQNLDFLQQQQVLILPTTSSTHAFPTWLALHKAFQASIQATLTDEVTAHR